LHIAPVWYFTPFYSMLRAVTGEFATVLALILLAVVFFAARKLPKIFTAPLWIVGLGVAVSLGLLPGLANMFGFLAPVLTPLLKAMPFLGGIDAKFWGVVAMGGGVVILFFLPWLDYSPVKSIRYRAGWHKYMYAVFVIDFLALGYLGTLPPSEVGGRISQIGTLFYFGFFLLMPWWSRIGDPKPVPSRVNFVAH
jgi:ubiquinol-cytochrome c reductase cytochrome b subunit